MTTAVWRVFDYMFAIPLFGMMLWVLSGIIVEFRPLSETGAVYDFANYIWYGAPIVFLVFGAFWFLSILKEWRVERRL